MSVSLWWDAGGLRNTHARVHISPTAPLLMSSLLAGSSHHSSLTGKKSYQCPNLERFLPHRRIFDQTLISKETCLFGFRLQLRESTREGGVTAEVVAEAKTSLHPSMTTWLWYRLEVETLQFISWHAGSKSSARNTSTQLGEAVMLF